MTITLPVKRTTGATLRERLSENAVEHVLPARYLRRDAHGAVTETPAELFRRVAESVAAAEAEHGGDADRWAARYETLLTELAFVPNSPTLMNAGTETPQLAACFVISPRDSLASIFETLGHAAAVFQSGGGVGYSFSGLRPRGDPVSAAGGVASGPVSFMRVYDEMCEQIRQGGRRRGAQMAVLRADHPDVGRFCVAKREEGALANFNVSVGVTDAFADSVEGDADYPLVNPRTGEQHRVTDATAAFYDPAFADAHESAVEENLWRDYAEEIPGLAGYRDRVDLAVGEPAALPAGLVWRLVVDGAWHNGEPGLCFLDEINREHSFDVAAHPTHRIAATNPCGEQPLEEFEACTLGHVNLSVMAAEGRTPWPSFRGGDGSGGSGGEDDGDGDDGDDSLSAAVEAFLDLAVDRERLDRTVRDGVRFLDDVVTAGEFPLSEIRRQSSALRKIGLGVMGFAELVLQFGVRYGSDASIEIGRQLMAHVNRVATDESHELAAERGSFPEWGDSKYADPLAYPDWFERHTGATAADWPDGYPVRNHSTTSVAPTGTTSMLANTSGGIEPLFNVAYFKNVAEDVRGEDLLVEFDDYFLRVLAANDLDVEAVRAEARELLRTGEFRGGRDLSIPTEIAETFVTASEVPAEEHVRMQAAFQAHVDSGISKTINLARDADRADVSEAFRLARDLGCKGLTVYRDRSRGRQVLTTRPQEPVDSRTPPDESRCCPV